MSENDDMLLNLFATAMNQSDAIGLRDDLLNIAVPCLKELKEDSKKAQAAWDKIEARLKEEVQ